MTNAPTTTRPQPMPASTAQPQPKALPAPMTPGEKLLKRLVQYPGRVVTLTVVIDVQGQPQIIAIVSETKAEVLCAS